MLVKKPAVVCAALLAFGAVARAADLPVKPPLAPIVAVQSWAGWYAGLNAGAVSGDEHVSWSAVASGSGFNALGASDINISSPGHVRLTGFTGGGQTGYNFQFQSLVVGPEADFQYTGINGSRSLLSAIFQNPYTQSVQSNWLSTIRGRLGIANQSWLFYATAGLAVGQTDFTDNFMGLHGVGPINSSLNGTHAGWAAGAGAEVIAAGAWSIKLEYLHVDLGSQTDTAQSQINSAAITHSHSLTEDIARIGVNYHWNPL
jgi:outer membrane immunogenic protein